MPVQAPCQWCDAGDSLRRGSFEEHFLLILWNAVACIAYFNDYMVIGAVCHCIEAYFSSFMTVFGGIREQIVDDLVKFVGVYPSHHALWVTVDGKLHVFLEDEWLKAFCRFVDIAHHIALGHEQFQFSLLRFACFENLLE